MEHDATMELVDCEGTAARIYREARADPDNPPGPVILAQQWLGRDALVRVPRGSLSSDAAASCVNGQRRIMVRQGLSPERLAWAVAHELAELALLEEGYSRADIEQLADTIAACIIAPRGAVRQVAAGLEPEEQVGSVADAFGVTDTCAALRVGEVFDAPVVVVAPRVRARGAMFEWPPERELRRLARARAIPAGLVRWACRDDRRRVVFVGQEG